MPCTLPKPQRLYRRKVIDRMFGSGARSLSVYPLRVVYMVLDEADRQEAPVAMLVSVPKRRLHHAVDRNRVKRLVREAYRLNKGALLAAMQEQGRRLAIVIIFTASELPTQEVVTGRVRTALARIQERLQ